MTYRTRSDTCIDWIMINVFCFVLFFRFVFEVGRNTHSKEEVGEQKRQQMVMEHGGRKVE